MSIDAGEKKGSPKFIGVSSYNTAGLATSRSHIDMS